MAEDIWQNLPYPTAHQSVFQAGWVQLDEQWQQPELAETWSQIRTVRQEVNRVLEQARTAKDIGSSLEAKVLLYVADGDLREQLAAMNPGDAMGQARRFAIAPDSNHVDELRYLFLVSQVEVLDSPAALAGVKCSSESDALGIGVVDAEGQKCERCWNYSTHVGESSDDPTICDRCVEALGGTF
jgi:isoleucyl-tRNA synthetase